MKMAYGSDFHFEFHKFGKSLEIIRGWEFEPDTEKIVIAGDLHLGAENVLVTLNHIYTAFKIPVIYVPGNHEYYDSSYKEVNTEFVKHGLNTKEYNILLNHWESSGEIQICGCMGNIDGSFENINSWKHGALNDFRLISDFEELHQSMGKNEHNILDRALNEKFKTQIVVTHTMPSPKCISPKYEGNYLNACFTNDWEDLIVKHEPKYWICGHTHDIRTVDIHNTKVLMNPYGYPRENKNWKWEYIDA